MTSFSGLINLLEQLKETFAYTYQFFIKDTDEEPD